MIVIKEAITKKELKQFVTFPFQLYKNSPYWVPPIIKEELKGFDKNKNPAFLNAEVNFFLAYKNNKLAGRIAVIANWQEIKNQGIPKIRFGWFDFIDDKNVSKALLDKVFEIGRSHKLEYAEGPMGFSNLDKVGVLIEGFDHISSMITWYNHAYYQEHLESLGFVTEKEYIESEFSFNNVQNSETFYKADALIRQRYGLRAINFTSTAEVMPYVDKMFDLFNTSYAQLSSFVAISEEQKEYFKKKYVPFINPEYIKYVVDKDDNLVAFSIVMPSFSRALQKTNGKLFPFGFLHVLRAKKQSKDVLFYLIGILPEYQSKGVTATIFKEYFETFKKNGIENCIRTPELIENKAIQNLWKHFDPKIYARRRTYRKDL